VQTVREREKQELFFFSRPAQFLFFQELSPIILRVELVENSALVPIAFLRARTV